MDQQIGVTIKNQKDRCCLLYDIADARIVKKAQVSRIPESVDMHVIVSRDSAFAQLSNMSAIMQLRGARLLNAIFTDVSSIVMGGLK